MTSALFSPITFRHLTLANRIAVSPMCRYNSTNGSATDGHLMHLGSMAMGAAGLIIVEMTNVSMDGRKGSQQLPTRACHPSLRPQLFPQLQKAAS